MTFPIFTQPIAIMLLCSMTACVRAKLDESPVGRSISEVEIRYVGEKTVDDGTLMSHMRSKPGDKYTLEALDSDIISLYESELVNEARFLPELDGDSVRIIAEVSTRPRNGPPFCIGNTAFSDKKLVEVSGLAKGDSVTLDALEKARQKLHMYYVSRGYVDAKVICRAFRGGDSSPGDYIFEVDEGSTTPQDQSIMKEAERDEP